MAARPDNPEAQKRRAIEALVSGSSRATAAAAAGVSERTLRRWALSEGFSAALRAAYDQTFADALRVLRGAAIDAVNALRAVASDPAAPPPARVAAARTIIEEGRKAMELDVMEARLAALESQLGNRSTIEAASGGGAK